MATLTIKPTAAGNDVQIKSGDGNTTHATFGDTSTVTLGTATITNATIADATITAGTFPAGHVVQTTAVTRGNTRTDVNTASGYQSTVVASTITPNYDDSAIIAFANFNVFFSSESSGDMGIALRFLKAGTGVSTTYPLGMYTSYGNSAQYHNGYYQAFPDHNEMGQIYQLVLQDEDCETTNAITYTLQCAQYHVDNTLLVGSNVWNNFQWSIYLMEIKR